jgi:hypothetical protein
MTVEEKVREIMLCEELPDSEKLDQLHRPHLDRCVQDR